MTIAVTVTVPVDVECVVTDMWDGEHGPHTRHTVGPGSSQTFHLWGDKQLLITEVKLEETK